eukprot:15456608-Alexandrium_andersonii.AAC.1
MPPEVGSAAVRPEDLRPGPIPALRPKAALVPTAQTAEGAPPPPARAEAADRGAAQQGEERYETARSAT